MRRASQLRTPTIHQEDVRTFIDKMFRDHQHSCPLLTRYEDSFPFELSHMCLCSPKCYLDDCLLLRKRKCSLKVLPPLRCGDLARSHVTPPTASVRTSSQNLYSIRR